MVLSFFFFFSAFQRSRRRDWGDLAAAEKGSLVGCVCRLLFALF